MVQQFGWLNEHQFLDAVAVAMITPGPVVITVAFIGFLVAGLAGADHGGDRDLPARLCVYHSPRPLVQTTPRQPAAEGLRGRGHGGCHRRHHGRRRPLGARAIVDWPMALIGLASLGVLWHFKVPEPLLVALSGLVGLVLWSLVRTG